MGAKVMPFEELCVPLQSKLVQNALFARHIEITKRYARLANGNVGNFQ